MTLDATRPRLPTLTSLRFFAALHVFCFHLVAFRILTSPSFFYRFASIGYVGVSLFFVLSGFILVYTYAGRDVTPREFWRARFARVYPAYAFSLLVTLPSFLLAVSHTKFSVAPWPFAHLKLGMALQIALLHAWVPPAALMWNPVSWSLSVEAFFYALFPFLLKRLTPLRPGTLVVIAILFWFASLAMTTGYTVLNPDRLSDLHSAAYNSWWLAIVKFNPLVRVPEFLIGMACGLHFLRSRANPKWALPLVCVGLSVFALAAYFSNAIPYPIMHTSLLAPAFAAIIYALALQPPSLSILTLRPLVLLGDASYSFYLLHWFVLWACFFGLNLGFRSLPASGAWLSLACACLISVLVFRLLEEPLRRKLRGCSSAPISSPSDVQPVHEVTV